jgi:Uma2 family endonuclease
MSSASRRAGLTDLARHAEHGLPDYWALDLGRDLMLVHRDPTPDGYRSVQIARRGDRIAPLAFPDCELSVDDVLGPGLETADDQPVRVIPAGAFASSASDSA